MPAKKRYLKAGITNKADNLIRTDLDEADSWMEDVSIPYYPVHSQAHVTNMAHSLMLQKANFQNYELTYPAK